MNKKNEILGIDKVHIYYIFNLSLGIILAYFIWSFVIPTLISALSAITILFESMDVSKSSPELKLMIIFIGFYLISYLIRAIIRLFEYFSDLSKELLIEDKKGETK